MACIEIFGMSRSGKTTQINALVDTLNREELSSVVVGRPMVPFKEFSSVPSFHRHYLNHLVDAIEANRDKDFVILDRGVYDRAVLLDFDLENGSISAREYRKLRRELEQNIPKVDTGFLFMVSPEESLRRYVSQRAKGLDFSYLNTGLISGDEPKNLETLYQMYQELEGLPKIKTIDALRDVTDISQEIASCILNHAER